MSVETDTGDDLLGPAALTSAQLGMVTSAAVHRTVRSPAISASPIPYDWGSPATAGLWRVDVREGAGLELAQYSYFVKLLRHTRLWPGLSHLPDDASRTEFVGFFPWRAELEMYESGISSVLPAGMRMPILHHVKYADDDHIALWWEFIIQRPGPWRPADYQRAAYRLGQLAARRREGAAINDALPAVARDPHPDGSSLRYFTERRILRGALPAFQDGTIWRHPVLARAVAAVADPGLPDAMLALGARLPRILDRLDRLPQTHAHGDASPQNLLRPANEPDALVVIDWGFGSLLPVGFDLGQLLTGLASAGQTDPAELAGIDAVIFPAYLDGLAAEGYDFERGAVRCGYIGGLAARSALCAVPIEKLSSAAPTQEVEEQFATRLRLTRVLLDMAAELG